MPSNGLRDITLKPKQPMVQDIRPTQKQERDIFDGGNGGPYLPDVSGNDPRALQRSAQRPL